MERSSERRKHKRVALSIPAMVRGPQDAQRPMLEEASTVNISQRGVYLKTGDRPEISPGEKVNLHISIPRSEANIFPFSRLAGKAKVVRIEKEGMALKFDDDLIFLAVAC